MGSARTGASMYPNLDARAGFFGSDKFDGD